MYIYVSIYLSITSCRLELLKTLTATRIGLRPLPNVCPSNNTKLSGGAAPDSVALWNVQHIFLTLTPQSTLTRSGVTCYMSRFFLSLSSLLSFSSFHPSFFTFYNSEADKCKIYCVSYFFLSFFLFSSFTFFSIKTGCSIINLILYSNKLMQLILEVSLQTS